MTVADLNGNLTQVTFLPVAEMPVPKVYGYIDPLEGSPTKEMSKKLERGELPLGEYKARDDQNENFTAVFD